MENQKTGIPTIVISILLGISVFFSYLPFDDGGYIGFYICLFQDFIIFFYHNVIKNFKLYIGCTLLLIVSNIINCIISVIWTGSLNEQITEQGTDILGCVMAQAALIIYAGIIFLVTVIVFIECIISIGMREYQRRKKKNKN